MTTWKPKDLSARDALMNDHGVLYLVVSSSSPCWNSYRNREIMNVEIKSLLNDDDCTTQINTPANASVETCGPV